MKLRHLVFSATLGLALTSLSGCLQGPNTGVKEIPPQWSDSDQAPGPSNGQGAVTPNQVNADKAEQLVQQGEKLLTPLTFMYAAEKFRDAAVFDPTNVRAQFYSRLIAIPMSAEGIYGRIHPDFVDKLPSLTQERYRISRQGLQRRPQALVRFLTLGNPDIKTETDAQDLILQITDKVDSLRTFLAANLDRQLTLNFYHYDDMSRSTCTVTRPAPTSEPELIGCGRVTRKSIRLDRADLEALRLYVGAMQLYLISFTSYDMTGLLDVVKRRERNPNFGTHREITEDLFAAPNFGRLRRQNRMPAVLSIGQDVVLALRYARRMQDDLCGPGRTMRSSEILPRGICIPDRTRDGQSVNGLIDAAELAFSGTQVTINFLRGQRWESTELNPYATFKNPPSDVRVFFPVRYTSCDQPAELHDPTYGGLFPGGDAVKVMFEGGKPCVISAPVRGPASRSSNVQNGLMRNQ